MFSLICLSSGVTQRLSASNEENLTLSGQQQQPLLGFLYLFISAFPRRESCRWAAFAAVVSSQSWKIKKKMGVRAAEEEEWDTFGTEPQLKVWRRGGGGGGGGSCPLENTSFSCETPLFSSFSLCCPGGNIPGGWILGYSHLRPKNKTEKKKNQFHFQISHPVTSSRFRFHLTFSCPVSWPGFDPDTGVCEKHAECV